MNALRPARILACTALLALGLAGPAHAGPREESRLAEAAAVLDDAARMPDQTAPDWLLRRAHGVAIIPNVVKVGLGIGGRGGRGVLLVREPDGSWSNPAFIRLAGGSFGWQAGIQESDIILVFTTRRSVEGITGGKFTLGADASVAVGPVGRAVSGSTDVTLNAEVYSYSQARGLFGGIAIDGSVISIDHRANEAYYQRPGVLASEIFDATAPAAPATSQGLLTSLRRFAPEVPAATATATASGDGSGAAATPPAVARPAPVDPSPPAEERGLESGGAATFPLEDKPPQ